MENQKLNYLIKSKGLHLQSDLSRSKPLELESFRGHTNIETNVYEFFASYDIISKKFTDADKSQYLYQNYLSDNIQREVKHLRGNYKDMKKYLIAKHGNVNTLLQHKMNKIRSLKPPNRKTPRQEQLAYFQSFMEIIEQLCSLIDINKDEYPFMKSELLNYNAMTAICRMLPDYYFEKWMDIFCCSTRVEDKQSLDGEEAFAALKIILRDALRGLELKEELGYPEFTDYRQQNKKPNYNNNNNYVNNENKYDDRNKSNDSYQFGIDKPLSGTNMIPIEESKQSKEFVLDHYYGAPCLHDKFYRVKECFSGKCQIFLNMTPDERYQKAVERCVCTLCLVYGCRLRGQKCSLSKVLPRNIECKQCVAVNVEMNVLLCGKHKNDSPEVQQAIRQFLPGATDDTRAKLFFMDSVYRYHADEVRGNTPGRRNEYAFDLDNGRKVDLSSIMKIDEIQLISSQTVEDASKEAVMIKR